MRWHARVLPERLLRALRRAAPVLGDLGFVLGGGTAVALWFGHRRSADLDFFRTEPLSAPERLAEELRRQAGFIPRDLAPGTLHGSLAGFRVSFFDYPYPPLRPPIRWERTGIYVLTPDDLATMKLVALVQRGDRKDFVDIYALGLRWRPLPELLRLYLRRYGLTDPGHVLRALTYTVDAEAQPMPEMLWDVPWEEIRATIAGWVRDLERLWTEGDP